MVRIKLWPCFFTVWRKAPNQIEPMISIKANSKRNGKMAGPTIRAAALAQFFGLSPPAIVDMGENLRIGARP